MKPLDFPQHRTAPTAPRRPTVLSLEWSSYYVEELQRDEPALREKPFLLYEKKVVVDANLKARALGIAPGSSLGLARTLMADGGVIRPYPADRFHNSQRLWLDICAEHSGRIEPEAPHSAYIDLSAHPQPLFVARKLLEALTLVIPVPARVGVGASKWTARLSAGIDGTRLTPMGITELAEVEIDRLAPLDPDVRERLSFLGYRRAGQVANAPLTSMRAQFGVDAWRVQSVCRGEFADQVRAEYPPDSIAECLVFGHFLENRAEVDAALGLIARRLGERLKRRTAQTQALHVSLERDGGEKVVMERHFSKPLHNPTSVHAALELLVQSALNRPLCGLKVSLTQLTPIRAVQPELATIRDLGYQQTESLMPHAVERIRQAFGSGCIVQASDIAVPRRKRVLKQWKDAIGWR